MIMTSNFVILILNKESLIGLVVNPKYVYLTMRKMNMLSILESRDYIKYLGILIDNNFTWKYHTDTVSLKISKNGWLPCETASFRTPAN